MKSALKYFLLTMVMASGCKYKVQYSTGSYLREGAGRELSYELSVNKQNSGKLLVIIPDNPDSLDVAKSEISALFAKKEFNVLVPGKPGGDVYRIRELDSRQNRIDDLAFIINKLDTLRKTELIIMGIGEGAYVLPELSAMVHPSKMIVVNAGVYSPLHELEFIATEDSLAPSGKSLLHYFALDQDGLKNKVDKIKNENFGQNQLAPNSNWSWFSYYQKPLIDQLPGNVTPILWVNYENYPLISATGSSLTRSITKAVPGLHYKQLKGHGNLNNEQEVDPFITEIRKFLGWK